MQEEPWYQELREQWRPSQVRLLLIAESAPDAGADRTARRFFYAPTLSRADNLFRGVVDAMYGASKLKAGADRTYWLARLRDDGVYLIDLASAPVNKLSPRSRRETLTASVPECVTAAVELSPEGVIVCHAPTYALLDQPLRNIGLNILHDQPIPFPLGNHRARFVELFRQALERLN